MVAVTAQVTLVAINVNVNARAQRLAKHFEVATQCGSSDSLQTHTKLNIRASI